MKTLSEVVEKYIDQENLHRTEGRKGVENLCLLVNRLGYKDRMYFGQLSNGCSIGDLIEFLDDNSGAIEALYEWIGNSNVEEWRETLEAELEEDNDEEEED